MNLSEIKKQYTVVIVGSGLAGLYAALNFPEDVDILMLSKKERHQSNSSLAQGGVACVLDLEDDSYALHIEDTFIAGGRENDPDAVTQLVEEGPGDVLKTIEYGVEYDRYENGELIKTEKLSPSYYSARKEEIARNEAFKYVNIITSKGIFVTDG